MNGFSVAFTGLPRQYQNLKEELAEASDRVLSTGRVLDGEYTAQFEAAMAKRCDRQYAITTNSCTQALIIAQWALDLHGKRVAVPTQSFAATLNSTVLAQNTPVFYDVDHSAMLDFDKINFRDDSIDAVMYVNLFGHILDYDKLALLTKYWHESQSIKLIEDAAQSFGATYKGRPSGSFGDVSVLSFDPTKNLPNYGSGGMILTNDPTVALMCINYKDNGKYNGHVLTGTNSKMSEVDCAHMLIKLGHFDEWQKRRAEIADFYTQNLVGYVDVNLPSDDVESAWHKYVIHVNNRSRLQGSLKKAGIETKVHYPTPLHLLDLAFNYHPGATATSNPIIGACPMANQHSRTALSLPIYPEMSDAEVEYVTESVIEYYNAG